MMVNFSQDLDATKSAESPSSGQYASVVVDTCRLFREGMLRILSNSCVDVVAATANIGDALAEIDHNGESRKIELLICSLDPLHRLEPQLAAIQAVRQRNPATKTVLLMPGCTAEDLVAAVLCGVDGVILKDISGEKLIAALDLVMHGQHVLPLGVALQIFAGHRGGVKSGGHEGQEAPAWADPRFHVRRLPQTNDEGARANESAIDASVFKAAEAAGAQGRMSQNANRNLGLSEREAQILQCLVEGCANKLIARRLDIAEATVKAHIKGLLRKINVSNRTQAAIWALNQNAGAMPGIEIPAASSIQPGHSTGVQDEAAPPSEPRMSDMIAVFPGAINGLSPRDHA